MSYPHDSTWTSCTVASFVIRRPYRTHHLHLVDEREGLDRCLRFRDTLRAHRQLAAEYVALKRALAARFREDREGYTKAKSNFINDADS